MATAVRDAGLTIELYPATFGNSIEIASESSGIVVINAAFGVMPDCRVAGAGTRVLDATHAPELALLPQSDGLCVGFDYVFASLRKLLPVTDGGALRAIRSHMPIPRPRQDPGHEHEARDLERLLHLKKRYIDGEDVNKADFYPAVKELEVRMAQRSSPCAISQVAEDRIRTIDVAAAVDTARQNVEHSKDILRSAVGEIDNACIDVLETETFIALLCTNATAKRFLIARLINDRIYPATLWPVDGMRGVSTATHGFIDRLVVLNADLRYSTEHMTSVSDRIRASIRSFDSPNRGRQEHSG